jgi:flagellar hook-associated protein
MSIGAIGSTPSFWQQDQSYWQQAQENDNSTSATDSVINAIGSAETNLGKGLASIANQTALSRVHSQLSAAIQNILNGNTGSSSSSSSGASSSSSSNSSPSPATGAGTAALSISTPLSLLGILAGGTITICAGANTTTYRSTGTDTVGDLMNAINANDFGNAAVTASLSRNGRLVLTSKNDTDTITVGGIYASNIGFAVGKQTFTPTKGTSSSSTASSGRGTSAPAANAASSTSNGNSTSRANGKKSYSTEASEMLSSASSLLSDSGDGGSLVDMLA